MKRKRGELSIVWNFAGQGAGWGLISGGALGALFPILYALDIWGIFYSLFGFTFGLIVGLPTGLLIGIIMGFVTTQLIALADGIYRILMMTVAVIGTTLFSGAFIHLLSQLLAADGFPMIPTLVAGAASLFVSNHIVNWWMNEVKSNTLDTAPPRTENIRYSDQDAGIKRKPSNWQIIRAYAMQGMRWGMIAGGILGALYPVIYTMEIRGIFFSAAGFFYGALLGVPLGLVTGAVMGLFAMLLVAMNASNAYAEFVLDLGFICIMVMSGMVFYSLFDEGTVAAHLLLPAGIASLASLFAIKRTIHRWAYEDTNAATAEIEI